MISTHECRLCRRGEPSCPRTTCRTRPAPPPPAPSGQPPAPPSPGTRNPAYAPAGQVSGRATGAPNGRGGVCCGERRREGGEGKGNARAPSAPAPRARRRAAAASPRASPPGPTWPCAPPHPPAAGAGAAPVSGAARRRVRFEERDGARGAERRRACRASLFIAFFSALAAAFRVVRDLATPCACGARAERGRERAVMTHGRAP